MNETYESVLKRLKPGDPKEAAATERAWTNFLAVVAALRGPDGCPWDKQQTYASLTQYVLEEAWEVAVGALEGDANKLREELGDLLLEIALYCQIAAERGDFSPRDVLLGITEKLIRRHPHVFGDRDAESPEEVEALWAEIKRSEPGRYEKAHSLMDEVPKGMPGLMRAQRQQTLAGQEGFDWDGPGPVFDKIEEELKELREATDGGVQENIRVEMGDLLYACVNLARHLKVDAETAILGAVNKFGGRYREMERRLASRGVTVRDADEKELDRLWEDIKRENCKEHMAGRESSEQDGTSQ